MPDESNRKRHRSDRTSSPSERSSSKDPENRGHRQHQHKRRRENNTDPGVNEDTLTKILAGVNDMKQQFVAWTTRVTAIEAKIERKLWCNVPVFWRIRRRSTINSPVRLAEGIRQYKYCCQQSRH